MIDRLNPNGFTLTFGKRIGLFACVFVLCFIICSVIAGIVMSIAGSTSVPALRILTVVQDVVVFILPVIASVIMITCKLDAFLSVNKRPSMSSVIIVLLAVLLSIPAMNVLIQWNESISFPESMKGLEEWMRASEENAASSIKMLLGGGSVADLVLSVMIVGLLSGLSEELFFRGMLQKLLITRPMNAHLAIWTTAIVFSAIHLQFYGFFPRLLLGAFFGYLVWWSGCLWLPIIAHAFNNTLVVVAQWMYNAGITDSDISKIGTVSDATDAVIAAISVVITVAAMRLLYRQIRKS